MTRSSIRFIALTGLLVILYVALGRLTFAASVDYGTVTSLIFAPEGVALSFAILFGPQLALGVLVGQTLLSYWSGVSLFTGLGIGTFNALEAWLGGHLFRRWRLSCGFDRPRDVIMFAVMIFFVLQPISATGGVTVLYAAGFIAPKIAQWLSSAWLVPSSTQPAPTLALTPMVWVQWWLANSLGQLLVAPLLVAWLTPRKHQIEPHGLLKLTGVLSATVGVLLLIHYNPALRPALLTMTYALMIWIGLRHSIRAVSAFNLLVMVIIVWEAVQVSGFLPDLLAPDRLLYASLFVATTAFASLLLFSMFEERRDLIRQLTQLACTDALTQVDNRRYFMECAEQELSRAQRHSYPLSLVLLDLDHFKVINDRHGHETGDQVLALFAACCHRIVRASDRVGRVGGEEFALLLPHSQGKAAVHATERLQQVVRAARLPAPDGSNISFTFSAGVVESSTQASLADMYRAADQALYEAKRTGRDRVCMAATTLSPNPSPASGRGEPVT